jgi:hypothetical protein
MVGKFSETAGHRNAIRNFQLHRKTANRRDPAPKNITSPSQHFLLIFLYLVCTKGPVIVIKRTRAENPQLGIILKTCSSS